MTSAAEAAAGPAAYRASPWFFLCGPLAASVFALGLALNMRVFERHALALHRVLDMRRGEVPTARGLALFALALFALQLAVLALERWRRGGAFHAADERGNEALLLLYAAGAGLLLVCPYDVCHRSFRQFLVRRLGECLLDCGRSIAARASETNRGAHALQDAACGPSRVSAASSCRRTRRPSSRSSSPTDSRRCPSSSKTPPSRCCSSCSRCPPTATTDACETPT